MKRFMLTEAGMQVASIVTITQVCNTCLKLHASCFLKTMVIPDAGVHCNIYRFSTIPNQKLL